MAAERIEKLNEHFDLKDIVKILAAFVVIGGGLGLLGGPMGSGIGAGVGLAVGAGIMITIKLVNFYRRSNMPPEENYYVMLIDKTDDDQDRPELAESYADALELDDTDTQSSEESITNDNNNKTQRKPMFLAKVKESLVKSMCTLGLHKHKDPLLCGFTQEENILHPVKLGKR